MRCYVNFVQRIEKDEYQKWSPTYITLLTARSITKQPPNEQRSQINMSTLRIEGSVAFVTGANRGIGRAIVDALIARGASKVYAGARKLSSLESLLAAHPDKVVPVEIDVTDQEQITSAAGLAKDVTLLVNNAGIAGGAGLMLTDTAINDVWGKEFEVNVFGLTHVTQAFAPALNANGGGAIVNLASLASLVNFPLFQSYSVSKAAVHSITQALRIALPNTLVVGVYPGPVDTDMAEGIPFEKESPQNVANEILDGVESGQEDVFPDAMSKDMSGVYLSDPKQLERDMAAMVAGGVPA